MVVKAVILDFGGTLASGEMDWQDFHLGVLAILRSQGHSVELKKLKKAIGAALSRLERIRAQGKETTIEDVYGYALGRLGLPPDEEILEMIHDLFKERYVSTFYPSTEDVLEELAGRYKVALISNTMSDQPRLMLEEAGLDQHFEVIVCSRDLGIRKPNPKIFEHVLDRLGVGPDESVHVGDSVEADMEGAMNAGITPVWLKGPEGEPWHGYAISNICELPRFLEKIKAQH
jgi:HAD superfamily hydrolase (TIGR01549 family)